MMTPAPSVDIPLVEDNPNDLELTLRALKKANILNRIEVARDRVDAPDYIFGDGAHAGRKIEDSPKLILRDLKLPRIDGLKVVKRIEADPRTRTIPVVVPTSSREQRDVVESYNLGVDSHTVKPVDFEGFAGAVKNLGFDWLRLNQPPKVNG